MTEGHYQACFYRNKCGTILRFRKTEGLYHAYLINKIHKLFFRMTEELYQSCFIELDAVLRNQ